MFSMYLNLTSNFQDITYLSSDVLKEDGSKNDNIRCMIKPLTAENDFVKPVPSV